jgi:hypothetical protein
MDDLEKAQEIFRKVLQMRIQVEDKPLPRWVFLLTSLVQVQLDFPSLRRFFTEQNTEHLPYLGGHQSEEKFRSLIH